MSQTVDTIIDSQTNVVRSYAVNSTTNRVTTVTNEDITTVVTIVNPVTEIEVFSVLGGCRETFKNLHLLEMFASFGCRLRNFSAFKLFRKTRF